MRYCSCCENIKPLFILHLSVCIKGKIVSTPVGGCVRQPATADQVVLSVEAISPQVGATFSELIFNSFRIIAHKEVDHPIPAVLFLPKHSM